MLTIETLERIKLGAKITHFNGIYSIILGLFYIIASSLILKIDFMSINSIWQIFEKYNPQISFLFIKFVILTGIFLIGFGITVIYLSNYINKKKDRAAWVMLFIIGILVWASILTIEILNRNIYTIIPLFVGWISFVVGMLIPIKYYTQRDYDEY